MYSEILKQDYKIKGAEIVFADGVIYNKDEMKYLKKVNSDVELMRLTHSAKKMFKAEVVHSTQKYPNRVCI